MIVDDITIFVCVGLVVLMLLSSFADVFFKRIRLGEDVQREGCNKPVSVVVIADNDAVGLKKNLPYILSQDYQPGFDVIVVVCKDDDGTGDVLKSFASHPNLRTTFVPSSSRYVSRRKVAVTLGVKASGHDLILLTDACCKPASEHWIGGMASNCDAETNLVIGYCNYSENAGSFKVFDRLRRNYVMMREAENGLAYASCGSNLMFSKSMFMSEDGFRGSLKYIGGEYDFLVNKYASATNAVMEARTDCRMEESTPTDKEWNNRNLLYMETRRHLQRKLRHRAYYNLDMFSFHLSLITALCFAAYSYFETNWVLLAVSVIALVMPFVVRVLNARRAIRMFDAEVSLWKVIPYELCSVFHNFKYIVRYKLSNKAEFICHKS